MINDISINFSNSSWERLIMNYTEYGTFTSY